MSKYEDILSQYGIDSTETEKIEISATDMSYKFEVGVEYIFLIGNSHYFYRDADDKKCEKGTPGARVAFGMLDMFTVSKGNETFIDDKMEFNKDLPPTAFKYGQFINLQPDKQFQNKNLFQGFYIDKQPELAVVQEDGRNYNINLAVLPVYVGVPAKVVFGIGKKKTSRPYVESIELLDHSIDAKKIENRKKVIATIENKLDVLWKAVKKDKGTGNAGVAPDADIDPDDILNQYVK